MAEHEVLFTSDRHAAGQLIGFAVSNIVDIGTEKIWIGLVSGHDAKTTNEHPWIQRCHPDLDTTSTRAGGGYVDDRLWVINASQDRHPVRTAALRDILIPDWVIEWG